MFNGWYEDLMYESMCDKLTDGPSAEIFVKSREGYRDRQMDREKERERRGRELASQPGRWIEKEKKKTGNTSLTVMNTMPQADFAFENDN